MSKDSTRCAHNCRLLVCGYRLLGVISKWQKPCVVQRGYATCVWYFQVPRLNVGSYLLQAMGMMNRGLNLPQIQRIMNEFEKESATMDMKEEMMSDAVDDVMDDELEDEEEESDKFLRQVLDEIGVDIAQQVEFVL